MTLRILCGAEPADSHHLRYMKLLTGAGVEVHLVDHSVVFERRELPVASHARWPRSGRRTATKLFGSAIGNRVADWALTLQLRSAWRRSRAELCHIHWIDDRPFRCAAAGLRPLVVTAYGSDLNNTRLPDYDPALLELVKKGLAEVDLFIADSEDMIVRAQELAGRPLNSLLLPIGIDTRLFRPGYDAEASAWRSRLAIPEGARVVLSPRVIGRNYRHDVIMDAFGMAVHDGAPDAYVLFKKYCADSASLEQILTIAERHGVSERVRVIDEVPYERLPVLYAMADFAVNLPRMDAFPVTFLECLACELPVLSNRLPAYSSNGVAPYLTFVDDEDARTLSRRLIAMCIGGPDELAVRNARAHVVRWFDETVFVGKLLSAYERVVHSAALVPAEPAVVG